LSSHPKVILFLLKGAQLLIWFLITTLCVQYNRII
jgi:hypothetical protein